jgi:hypothetical protein
MKIVLSVLLFCSLLLADRDGGPYIGFGYGTTQYDDDSVYFDQTENESKAMLFYGGAYINKYLSVEFSYVNFNSGNSYVVVDDTLVEKSMDFTTYNISTLAHYAFFDDVLDFYAKCGVGEVSSNGADVSGFTMVYGGGVGVRFNEMFSMKVAYDRYNIEYLDDVTKYQMNVDLIYGAFEVQF